VLDAASERVVVSRRCGFFVICRPDLLPGPAANPAPGAPDDPWRRRSRESVLPGAAPPRPFGPAITVTAADVAAFASDQRLGSRCQGGARGEADQATGAAHPASQVHVYGSCYGVAECGKRRCTRSHEEPGVDAASALASTAASAWVRWRYSDKCGGIMCREPARPASASSQAWRAAARRWRDDRGGRRCRLPDGIRQACARRPFPATTWSLP